MPPRDQELDRYVRYLRLRTQANSDNTLRSYRSDVKGLLTWADIDSVADLSEERFEQWLDHLHTGISSRTKRPYDPRSIERRIIAIRRFMAWASSDKVGLLPYNFAEDISYSAPEMLLKAPTHTEVMQLINVIPEDTVMGLRDQAMLYVMYGSAARCFQTAALELDDLRVDHDMLHLIKKGGGQQAVPLAPVAMDAVTLYCVEARPVLASRSDQPTEAVFLSKTGRPILPNAIVDVCSKYVAAAELPAWMSPHSLRHACATEMILGGADVTEIQQLLGHKSVKTTMRYIAITLVRLRETYGKSHPLMRGTDPQRACHPLERQVAAA